MDTSYHSSDPLGPPSQPDRLGRFAAPAPAPAPPPRVVVVDDDGDLLDMLTEVFRDDGFRVTPCRTLEAAIAAFNLEPAQLAVTDALLHDRTELPVARWLDEHHVALAGIVILTGANQALLERHAALIARLGAQVVLKPFEVEGLLQIARTLTGWPGQP